MATYVVEQLTSTIDSGATLTWSMANVNPPLPELAQPDKEQPKWIVMWQAAPINVIGPGVPGITVAPVTIILETDTTQTHVVTISCDENEGELAGISFLATYTLYAVFINVS